MPSFTTFVDMRFSRLTLFVCIFLQLCSMQAQDFSSYRWENRLILLFADAEENGDLAKQLKEFMSDKAALAERKLLIFFIHEQETRMIFPQSKSLSHQSDLWKQFAQKNTPFELQLIGLDGGRKLSKKAFVSKEYLYALIDGMPMRKAEIRAKARKQ